jgi:hypothetical protein
MSFEDAFGSWHRERDSKVLPAYAFTTQLATLEPPPPETQQLLGAIYGNQAAMETSSVSTLGRFARGVLLSRTHQPDL